MDQQSHKIARHAVVIGGSVAGLLAARVLSDHFERVTILERDRFPPEPQPRNGAPQARHTHILLMSGQQNLERLFPGLQDDLQQAGAPCLDWMKDLCSFVFTGLMPRFVSSHRTHPCSRDLLEWAIRQRVAVLPNVEILEGADASFLCADAAQMRITGVHFKPRSHPGSQGEDILADLVVDASGRESRTTQWLETLGYPPPTETRINSFLGYATRLYESPPGFSEWKSHLVRGLPPQDKRGGLIYGIEGDRWLVTLAGAGRDYPPTEEAGFLEFARSLAVPTLHAALQAAKPITPIYGYRKTENRWRHFERLQRWPYNFIAMGDSVCAFNPVYGQGMTVAAQGASLLDDYLHDTKWESGALPGIAFQKRLARLIKTPWLLATGDDFRFLETEGGRRSMITRWMHAYVDRVVYASLRDPRTYQDFVEVTHLLKPISALFAPRIITKALASSSGGSTQA